MLRQKSWLGKGGQVRWLSDEPRNYKDLPVRQLSSHTGGYGGLVSEKLTNRVYANIHEPSQREVTSEYGRDALFRIV